MAASVLFPGRPEIYQLPHSKLKEDFEIAVNVNVNICDNVSEGLFMQKAILAFYIGGMGAQNRNFHTELMARMGYESEASNISPSCQEKETKQCAQFRMHLLTKFH